MVERCWRGIGEVLERCWRGAGWCDVGEVLVRSTVSRQPDFVGNVAAAKI